MKTKQNTIIRFRLIDSFKIVTKEINLNVKATVNVLEAIKENGCKSKLVFTKLPNDDPVKRKPDISLAKKKLKWSPKISLDEGIKRTLVWYLGMKNNIRISEKRKTFGIYIFFVVVVFL